MLLVVLLSFRGRANYANLSRHSGLSEKAYRRWYGKKLDFIGFNRIGNNEIIPAPARKIAVLDASFVSKSGDKTHGLGNFYNGCQGKAEKGLEISTLAIVDVDFNTAYHVSTRQTPVKTKDADGSRVTAYLDHFKKDCHALPKDIRYLATDAYYSKQLFTNGVLALGYQQIGKLRCDANLRYLYTGEQKAKGRPRQYGDKMIIGDIAHLDFVEEKDGVKVYTAIVNCPTLRRDIRIVYLLRKNGYAVLFSTDTQLDALMLYRYYQARFQIEFLFRDAKQFMGLTHCQARSESALHSHFNACFTALNLMKWHDRQLSPQRNTISIASWKAKFFNVLFIERLSSNLAIDLNSIKSSPAYAGLCDFGVLAW
ncbi:MAG: transposase [Methylovulum miyakonense]|uniref:transposase n=1 Tax=Methylovulum miyakonense TaxID=645578 RepID=UPI003BB71414